jgi:hypothetical protein
VTKCTAYTHNVTEAAAEVYQHRKHDDTYAVQGEFLLARTDVTQACTLQADQPFTTSGIVLERMENNRILIEPKHGVTCITTRRDTPRGETGLRSLRNDQEDHVPAA